METEVEGPATDLLNTQVITEVEEEKNQLRAGYPRR